MNIFQRIKEVKLPFIAVIAALAFGGIVAPANAAGTSVTSADLLYTTINRGVSTIASNTISTTATVLANERVNGSYGWAEFADPQHLLTLQAGDSIKVSATYTNVTRASTASAISLTYTSWNGGNSGSQTNYSGSAPTSVTGANNTVSRTFALSTFPAGTYDNFYVNVNANLTDSAIAANDQIKFEYSYYLVRGGVETALQPRSQQNNSPATFRITKLNTKDHTAVSDDSFAYSNSNVCIYYGENGVTAGTQIEITARNTGTVSIASPMITPNMSGTLQPNSGIYSYTMPAISGNATNVSINFNLNSSGTLSAGQTWIPEITAVIAGTSTNVLDRCFRQQQVTPPAPAATTASVRPLPQINFAVSTANGISARPTSDTRKGTLNIEGSNLSDLTSITIGGKAATFTVKDGKLEIKLPAGVTGFPEVVMTNAGGSITMQNAIEIYAPTVQKLTQFTGERFTVAGTEALENAYIQSKDATALEATVVVAADATEAQIAKAVKAATKAVNYIDKVGKRIVRTAVTVVKTGEAGTKPTVEMAFTK